MRVVRVVVLPFDGKDGHVVLLDERSRDVVLRGERIGGAEDDVGTAGLERAHQVRRLGRHMEAGRDAVPGKWLLPLEPVPDGGQHGHVPVGPPDAAYAFGRERQVLDVEALGRRHRG